MNEPTLITLTQGIMYSANGLRRKLKHHAGMDDNVDLSQWRVFWVPQSWVEQGKPLVSGKRREDKGMTDPDDYEAELEKKKF
jgi:hypothetical protein